MDSIIRELIGIDRVAREKLESANNMRDEQERDAAAQIDSVRAEFTAHTQQLLDDFTASAERERDEAIAELVAEHEASAQQLNTRFAERRREWAETLVKRVKEC